MKVAYLGSQWLGERVKYLIERKAKLVDPTCAEIGFSILHKYIIKEPILSAPKRGWVNLHIGALPHYRGVHTIHHAIWNGDTHFGVTLHEMDEKFDRGPIIAVYNFKMCTTDIERVEDVYDQAFAVGWKLIDDYFENILRGHYTTCPNEGGKYYNTRHYLERKARMAA